MNVFECSLVVLAEVLLINSKKNTSKSFFFFSVVPADYVIIIMSVRTIFVATGLTGVQHSLLCFFNVPCILNSYFLRACLKMKWSVAFICATSRVNASCAHISSNSYVLCVVTA